MADSTVNDSALWYGYDVTAERTSPVNATTRTPQNELDKDAFLKLLLTQMQYQDPLNPTDDKQFLAQMAQFTALEQMRNLSQTFTNQQAYSLIGKGIYAEVLNEETNLYDEVAGIVTSVKVKKGEAFLMVGEKEVPIDKVQYVFSDGLSEGIGNLSANVVTSQNLALIGKMIQAITVNAKGEPTGFVEGLVDHVKFDKNGVPVLVVGNEEVYAKEVISIAEDYRLLNKTISGMTKNADGTTEMVTGAVDSVSIIDGKAYAVVGGRNVYIKNIGLLSDAIKYVNQTVKYDGDGGVVESIIVRDGVPYMKLKDSEVEINFAKFKGVTLDDEQTDDE